MYVEARPATKEYIDRVPYIQPAVRHPRPKLSPGLSAAEHKCTMSACPRNRLHLDTHAYGIAAEAARPPMAESMAAEVRGLCRGASG